MDHGRSPPANTPKPLESKSQIPETTTNITSKHTRSRSSSPVPISYPKNPLHTESPSYPTSRTSRFDPYFSRPSRERDDRRERERDDRFRRRNDRELHREERPLPPPHGPSHPFVPSYYPHNRRAGADFEENKRLGGTGASSSMSAFATRRNNNSNGPPPIVISRDPTNGNVLMRSGGTDIAPMDIVFPGMVDREGRPKHNEGFGGSRDSRGRATMFPVAAFEKMNRSSPVSSVRDNGSRNIPYRDFRGGDFSYFTRHIDNRDHLARGPNPFPGMRERDRDRNRDRERWERERNRERNRGRERWESERLRERERSDLTTSRFEQGDSYRPGEGYRDSRRDTNSMSAKKEGNEIYQSSHGSVTPDRRSSSVDSTKSTEKRKVLSGRETRKNSIDSTIQSLDEGSHTDAQVSSTPGPYGKRARDNSLSLSSELSSSSIMLEESKESIANSELRDEKRRKVHVSPRDYRDIKSQDVKRDNVLESPSGDERQSNCYLNREHGTESQDSSRRCDSSRMYSDQIHVNRYPKKLDNYNEANAKHNANPTAHYTSKSLSNDDKHLNTPGKTEEEHSDQLEEGEIGVSDISDSIDNSIESETWPSNEAVTSSIIRSISDPDEASLKQSSKVEFQSVTKADQTNTKNSNDSDGNILKSNSTEGATDIDYRIDKSSFIDHKGESPADKDSSLRSPNPLYDSMDSLEPGETNPVRKGCQHDDLGTDSGCKPTSLSPVPSNTGGNQLNTAFPISEAEQSRYSSPEVNVPSEIITDTSPESTSIAESKNLNNSSVKAENVEPIRSIYKVIKKETELNITELSCFAAAESSHTKSNISADQLIISDNKSVVSPKTETVKVPDTNMKSSIVPKIDASTKTNSLLQVDTVFPPVSDDSLVQSEQTKYPKCVEVKSASSSIVNVESSQNEISEHCDQPVSTNKHDEQKQPGILLEDHDKYEEESFDLRGPKTSFEEKQAIIPENTSNFDMEGVIALVENNSIEPGEIQDEVEGEVPPSNLDSSLTQEKIFAMIDKIDSEIGRYEELLVEVRKNKQSCIQDSNSKAEVRQDNEGESLAVDQYVEQESKPKNKPSPQPGASDLIETQSKPAANGKPQKAKKLSLHKKIYAENRMLVQTNVKPSLGPIFNKFEDYPFFCENIESHKRIRSLMFNHLRRKYDTLEQKENELKQKYKQYLDAWRVQIVKLDKYKEKKKGRKNLKDELLSSSGPSGLSVSRVQRHGGPYSSDTVRSEAELLEIIQSLENEELRNPNVRCLRAVATIPSMVLDPSKRELTKYDNRNNLVENPYKYYHCAGSIDSWTKEERDIFIRKYLLYPKQFGKIASFLKNKNARQCVLFYYREKKSIDFKGLITGRGKKRRQLTRKDTGKVVTSGGNKSKGNALLQDIDAASRSQGFEEVEDHPDALPAFKKKARFDYSQGSSVDPSTGAADSVKELTSKHRSDVVSNSIRYNEIVDNSDNKFKKRRDSVPIQMDRRSVESAVAVDESSLNCPNTKAPEFDTPDSTESISSTSLPRDTLNVKTSDALNSMSMEEGSNSTRERVIVQSMAVDTVHTEDSVNQNVTVQHPVNSKQSLFHKKESLDATVQVKQFSGKSTESEGNAIPIETVKSSSSKFATGKVETSIGKSPATKPNGSEISYVRSTPHRPFGMKPHRESHESATGKLFIKPNKPIIGKSSANKSGFNRNMAMKPIPVKPLGGKFIANERDATSKSNSIEERKGSPAQRKVSLFQERRSPLPQVRREQPMSEKKGVASQSKKIISSQEKRKRNISDEDKNDLHQEKKESLSDEKQRPTSEDKQKVSLEGKKGPSHIGKAESSSQKTNVMDIGSFTEKKELFSQDEVDIVDEVNAAIEDILDKDSSDEETIVEEQGTAFIASSSEFSSHITLRSGRDEDKPTDLSISMALSPCPKVDTRKLKESVQTLSTNSQPIVEDFDLSLDIPSSDSEELLDKKGEASETIDEDALLEEEINRALLSASSSDDEENGDQKSKDVCEQIDTQVVNQYEENSVEAPTNTAPAPILVSGTDAQVSRETREIISSNADSYNLTENTANQNSTIDPGVISSTLQTHIVHPDISLIAGYGIGPSTVHNISKSKGTDLEDDHTTLTNDESRQTPNEMSPARLKTGINSCSSTTCIEKDSIKTSSIELDEVSSEVSVSLNSKMQATMVEPSHSNVLEPSCSIPSQQISGSNAIIGLLSEPEYQVSTAAISGEQKSTLSENTLALAEQMITQSPLPKSDNTNIIHQGDIKIQGISISSQQIPPISIQTHNEPSITTPELDKCDPKIKLSILTSFGPEQPNPDDSARQSTPVFSSMGTSLTNKSSLTINSSEQPQTSTISSTCSRSGFSISDMVTSDTGPNKTSVVPEQVVESCAFDSFSRSHSPHSTNNNTSFSEIIKSSVVHLENQVDNSSIQSSVTQKYNNTVLSTAHQNAKFSDSSSNVQCTSSDIIYQSQQQYPIPNRSSFLSQSITPVSRLSTDSGSNVVQAGAQPIIPSVSSNYSTTSYPVETVNTHGQIPGKSAVYQPSENQTEAMSKPSPKLDSKPGMPSNRYVPSTDGLSISLITRNHNEKAEQTKYESTLPSTTYQVTTSDQASPAYSHSDTQSSLNRSGSCLRQSNPSMSSSLPHSRSEYYRDNPPLESRRQSSVSRILDPPTPLEAPIVSPTKSEHSTSPRSSRMEPSFFDGDRHGPRPTSKPVIQRARGVTDIFSLLNAPSEETQPVKVGKNALMDWFGEDIGPASSSEQPSVSSEGEIMNSQPQSQYGTNPTITNQSQPRIARNSYSYAQDSYPTAYKSQAMYSTSAPDFNSGASSNRGSIDNMSTSISDSSQMTRYQNSPNPSALLRSNQSIQPQVQLLQLQSQSVVPTALQSSVTPKAQLHNQPPTITKPRHRADSQGQSTSQSQNYGQNIRRTSSSHPSNHSQVPIAQLVSPIPVTQPSRVSAKSRQPKTRVQTQPQIQPQPSQSRILTQSSIQHPSSPANVQPIDGSIPQAQYAHLPLQQQPSLQSNYPAPASHHRQTHPLIQPSPLLSQQASIYSRSQSPAMNPPSSHPATQQTQPRRTSSPLQPLPVSHSRKPSNPSSLHAQSIPYPSHSLPLSTQPTRHPTPIPASRSRDTSQSVYSQNSRETVSMSPQQTTYSPDQLSYMQTRHSQQQVYPGSEASEGARNFQQARRVIHPHEGYHSSAPSPNILVDSTPNPNSGQTVYRQSPQITSNQHIYDTRENLVGQRFPEIIQSSLRTSTPLSQTSSHNSFSTYPPVSLPKDQPQPHQPRTLHRDSSSFLDNTPFRTGSPANLDQTVYRTGSPAILDQTIYRTASPTTLEGAQIRRTTSPATIDPSHYRHTTSPSVMDTSQYSRRPQSPVAHVGPGYPRHSPMSIQAPSSTSQIFHTMTSSPIAQNSTYSTPMNSMSMPGIFPHSSGAYPQQHPPPKK